MENCYNKRKFLQLGGLIVANLQLASNLKKYRVANNYTQDYVSMKLSISRQAYSNYERGKRNPDIDLLVKLANLYKITLTQLILIPFSNKTKKTQIKETNPYTIHGKVENCEETIFLSHEEISLVLNYREAKKEQKYVISSILNTK